MWKTTAETLPCNRAKHLEYLNLENSKVEGKIVDVQEKGEKKQLCTELIEAKISGTAVTFNMSFSERKNASFPKLTILEVSGNKLNMEVSDFLAPFSNCEALRTVKAANCGLYGELKNMTSARDTVFNHIFYWLIICDLSRFSSIFQIQIGSLL